MQLPDARPGGNVSRLLVGASARINYEWALRRPGKPPFLIVTEFPRSGGNWIRDMLGDALQMPVPRYSRLPVTFRSIVHNHDHRPTSHPTVYVIRDGRDVFLSHFHKTVATWNVAPPSLKRRIAKFHPSIIEIKDQDNPSENEWLLFYDEWKNRPLGSKVSWRQHVLNFVENTPSRTVIVRYEDMIRNPHGTIHAVTKQILARPIEADLIQFAVERNRFERQTGRKTGTVDNHATKRRGIAGAWRDEMPKYVLKKFEHDHKYVLP